MSDELTEQLRESLVLTENSPELEWWGDIGKLASALAKAQAEFLPVKKSSQNPFFKRSDGSGGSYADLAEVIDATRPALTKYGFAVVQLPSSGMTTVTITTLLLHESGGGIRSKLTLPSQKGEKLDVQTIGGAMTYARRFSYQAVVHVAGEEDDDGNRAAAGTPRTKGEQKKFAEEKVARMKGEAPPPSKVPAIDTITPAQRKRLWAISKENNWEEVALRDLLGSYGFEHSSEVTMSKYDEIISVLQNGRP